MSQRVREQWRSTMLTLPDRIFFDLLHNYLGELPSPHNRQDLVGRIETLLGLESFQAPLVDFLEDQDLQILSLLAWLGESTEEALFAMLQGSPGFERFMDFHQKVLVLEDRLWIWKAQGDAELKLNPLLAHLVPAVSARGLVPSSDSAEARPGTWLGDGFIAAVIASWDSLAATLKADQVLGKRGRDLMARLFAGLGDFPITSELDPGLGDLVMTAFSRLGLARQPQADSPPRLVAERVAQFCGLPRRDRMILLVAAAAHPLPDSLGGTGGPGFRAAGLIHDFAEFLAQYLALIPPGQHGLADLIRLWHTAWHKLGQRGPQGPVDQCIRTMALMGCFETSGNPELHYRLADLDPPIQPSPLVLTPSGDIHAGPWPDMERLLPLLAVLKLERFGTDSLYRIDPVLARSWLGEGHGAAELARAFEAATGRPMPEHLVFQFRQWEEEQCGVHLQAGFLLEVSELRRDEAEHLFAGQAGTRRLGDGLWFVERGSQDLLDELVRKGFLSETGINRALDPDSGRLADILPPLRPLSVRPLESGGQGTGGPGSSGGQPPVLAHGRPEARLAHCKELRDLIESKPWTSQQKDDALRRVLAGLIIHAGQLESPPRPSEQGRAQGFDFNAKVRLLDEAIRARNEYVQVKILGSAETTELTLWPQHVKGQGPDALLVARTMPEHKEMVLYVRKIVEVRRVRASLFV